MPDLEKMAPDRQETETVESSDTAPDAQENADLPPEAVTASLSETITESLFASEEPPAVPADEKTPEKPAASDGSDRDGSQSGVNGIVIAMSLCDAVIQAVGTERFHGGVRPDNISVREGQVYLGSTLKHGVGEFTPQELEYMAPELFWDGIRTPASDVYSIGLVLYSLYNYGRLPFWPAGGAITPNARASALQRRMSDESITPPANADAELAAIILRALAFRTEERWRDASELRGALGACDASNSPVDIALAMTGLLTRSADARASEQPAATKSHTYYDEGEIASGRIPQRRKNLSWLWILLAIIFIAGAIVLLVNDNFRFNGSSPAASAAPTAEPTPRPTAEPTPEATVTPEPSPTRRPSAPKYVVYRENVSWSEAVARCEELGGWLAIPANEEELERIAQLCDNEMLTFAWLGAYRKTGGVNFYTPEDELVRFFDWGDGEPSFTDSSDGEAEDYLMLWRRGEGDWVYNDSREDPVNSDYGFMYRNNIGFVCQMWE